MFGKLFLSAGAGNGMFSEQRNGVLVVSDGQSEPQTLSDVLRLCVQQLRDQLPEG